MKCNMRFRSVISTVLLLAGLSVSAGTSGAVAGTVEGSRALFEEGNALYEQGDYEAAIEAYTGLVERGIVDEDLYFNLGNAYYKNGELGRAVLFYERALRIAPRDGDARDNLTLVESLLRDRQFVRSENRVKRALLWVHRHLNMGETFALASSLYVLFCLLVVIYIFREMPLVISLYRRVSLLSPGRFIGLSREQDILLSAVIVFCLFVGSTLSAFDKLAIEKRHERAVVVAPEGAVFSGPTEDSTLQFKIHEGTRVSIRTKRPGWVQVDLPGELSGWLADDSVEEI